MRNLERITEGSQLRIESETVCWAMKPRRNVVEVTVTRRSAPEIGEINRFPQGHIEKWERKTPILLIYGKDREGVVWRLLVYKESRIHISP